MAKQFSTLARNVQQIFVSKVQVREPDALAGANLDCKEDNLLGIRNTFFDLSDSPPLKQWYADIRRVRSCPASEYGDDDQCDYEDDACKDDGSDLLNTPEPSPRPREPSKPWPTAGSYVKKPAASRTALKSGATPYRPAPAPVPACSTTYYAVPPAPTISTPGQGPLAAEYHSRVQASRVQFAQAQVQQNSLMTQHYPVPVGNVKEGPPILGSEALPSIGSGAHATGECRPCAFFHKNRCLTGRTCLFCHLCDAREKKRRVRLQKVNSKRA